MLGAGGFARELREYLRTVSAASDVRLVAQEAVSDALTVKEYQGRAESVSDEHATYLGSGLCDVKLRMAGEVRGRLGAPLVLSHSVWTSRIGAGTVVANGAVVAPNTVLGESVLVNYCASVGHDATVDDLCVIAPQAAVGGHCSIGRAAYVGAGAMIREHTRVGSGAFIGMGFASVTRHLRRFVPLLVWALVFFTSLTMLVLAGSSAYGRAVGPSVSGPILLASGAFGFVLSFSLPIRRRR